MQDMLSKKECLRILLIFKQRRKKTFSVGTILKMNLLITSYVKKQMLKCLSLQKVTMSKFKKKSFIHVKLHNRLDI